MRVGASASATAGTTLGTVAGAGTDTPSSADVDVATPASDLSSPSGDMPSPFPVVDDASSWQVAGAPSATAVADSAVVQAAARELQSEFAIKVAPAMRRSSSAGLLAANVSPPPEPRRAAPVAGPEPSKAALSVPVLSTGPVRVCGVAACCCPSCLGVTPDSPLSVRSKPQAVEKAN